MDWFGAAVWIRQYMVFIICLIHKQYVQGKNNGRLYYYIQSIKIKLLGYYPV